MSNEKMAAPLDEGLSEEQLQEIRERDFFGVRDSMVVADRSALLRHIDSLRLRSGWQPISTEAFADLLKPSAEYVVMQKHRVTGSLCRDIIHGAEFDSYTAFYLPNHLPAPPGDAP